MPIFLDLKRISLIFLFIYTSQISIWFLKAFSNMVINELQVKLVFVLYIQLLIVIQATL